MAIEMLSLLVNAELNNMKKNLNKNKEVTKIDYINKKGDVIFPIEIDSEKLHSVFADYRYNEYFYCWDDLKSLISSKTKVLKANFEFALDTLKVLCEAENFAGMIIMDNQKQFIANIAHPLVLNEILENLDILKYLKDQDKLNVIIYEFNPSVCKPDIIEKYKEAWNLTLGTINKYKIINPEFRIENLNENHDEKIENLFEVENSYINLEKNLNVRNLLIPLQIASKGMFLPFASVAVINAKGRGYSGLFGSSTGNINVVPGSDENNYSWEVCTGNYDKRTLRGWYTLSKINVNSMWNSTFVSKYHIEQTIAANQLTKVILEEAGL